MARILFVPEWLKSTLVTDADVEKFVNDPSALTELEYDVIYYHNAQLAFCRFLISDSKTNDIMLDIRNYGPDKLFADIMQHPTFSSPEYVMLKKRCWQEPIMWSEFVNTAKSGDDVQFEITATRDGKTLLVSASKRSGTVSESHVAANVAAVLDEGLKALHEGFRIQRSTSDVGEVFRENPILTSLYILKSFQ